MEQYDRVFIGYPIWWSDLPQILYTFFDTYDFSGKTVIFSAFWTIVVTILVAELRPISRMSFKDIGDAFVSGAKSTVSVAIACACVGIIVGICGLTGFALNVAHAIINIGQYAVPGSAAASLF